MGMHASATLFYGAIIGGSESEWKIRPPAWSPSDLRDYIYNTEGFSEVSDELDEAADEAIENDISLSEWEEHVLAKHQLSYRDNDSYEDKSEDEREQFWARRRETIGAYVCEISSSGVDEFQVFSVRVKDTRVDSGDYDTTLIERSLEVDPRWNGLLRAFLIELDFDEDEVDKLTFGWHIAASYG